MILKISHSNKKLESSMFPPLNVLLDFFYSLNHHEILLYRYAEVGTSDRIAIF
jgi:hypothetical protein